ncbi:dermonecrotic toxin domain-containing protein [Pseudomonas sp. BBP2017]|uniref:dermonecrotic toxin domain-containing protein n=1 Tax=Pseudomonas sp. BBP2017 TaxID=2109731 RepID=UPI000D131A80|nr:DUF6543 domain-containing protein [Pseudomonas sp. BBP2017]PSS57471.1 type III effector 1 [Pseudomonas sp. BBP2017]
MNDVTEPVIEPGDTEPARQLLPALERLNEWSVAFKARLDSQTTFLDLLEESLLVELRTYYSDDVDPRFIRDMLDAALQRRISGQVQGYDPQVHAPWHPDDAKPREIPEERRETMLQLVEGLASGMLNHYQDYLARHWHSRPASLRDGDAYDALVRQRIKEHHDALGALFEPKSLEGVTVEALRALIEAYQAAWYTQSSLLAVSSQQERKAIDKLGRMHLPDWVKLLDEATRSSIQERYEVKEGAREHVQGLLGDALSLHSHARRCARDHLREHLNREMEPDLIYVTRRLKDVEGAQEEKLTLTEVVAQGPIEVAQLYLPLEISGPVQHYRMPTAEQVGQLLKTVDAPASYLQSLIDCQQRDDVRQAMFDVYDSRLQHSALVARSAGHLSEQHYEKISALWAGQASDVEVCAVAPVNQSVCSDLLLFYREGEAGSVEELVLYAPDRLSGQEWIELVSLRALSAEIGGWLKAESGRQYLLRQLAQYSRKSAEEQMVKAVQKPSEWRLDLDVREQAKGYAACIEQGVAMRLAAWQVDVEQSTSPRWYSQLIIEERRAIGYEVRQASIYEKIFLAELGGYESFQDFAKRTISEAIQPYLMANDIKESVDPQSILIDYSSTLADGKSQVVNLVDLVCYGYDDNSGIDHPNKGVRSAVGQDLSRLRSAELARYARRAYVGEKYINAIRAEFLAQHSPAYRKRQQLFAQALERAMYRDVRIAHGSEQISVEVFKRLTGMVAILGRTINAPKVTSNAEDVASTDGVFRLSVDGHSVLGAYVFRYFEQATAQDWVYTPGAPDGILIRRYEDLNQAAADVLHDYLLKRVALVAQERVRTWLIALAAGGKHRDALRGGRQVITLAGEYDAYIEHALTDVDDATNSRAEVIKTQVFKGVTYSLPLFMVFPPFAVLLGGYFVVEPLREAIIAHTKGDSAKALSHWLEASWATLGLVVSVPGVSLRGAKPLFNQMRELLVPPRGPGHRAASLPRSMKFRKEWAVERPGNLQEVTEDGVWKGTFRSDKSGAEYFVRDRGRYFKVVLDANHGTLRVVKANRPHSYHREAIVRTADGRWVRNDTGVRGGNPTEDLGQITQLRQVSRGNGQPVPERGAMQGEAVVANFNANRADNYLYSLNAQTCVVVSLYNPATRAGAVIHFDHNIRRLIESTVRDVLARLGTVDAARPIRTVMAGGDWLTGADIGGPVSSVLRRNNLVPSWEHWSYSSCWGNTYGLTLDLQTGVTSVYKTPQSLVMELYSPILARARFNAPGLPGRAQSFMSRFRKEPLREGSRGVWLDSLGRPATASEINQQSFTVVDVT